MEAVPYVHKKNSQVAVPWLIQMRNNMDAISARKVQLGANLDKYQNLVISRLPFEGATKENNVCIVFHQGDDKNNPPVIVLRNDGTGNLIETSAGARLSPEGVWSVCIPVAVLPIAHGEVLTALASVEVGVCDFGSEKHFVPDPASFAQAVGFGDSKSIAPLSVASFALKAVKCLFDAMNKFMNDVNKRLVALELTAKKEIP